LAGKTDRTPTRPPGDLNLAIAKLSFEELAIAGMEPIVRGILRQWKYDDDEEPEEIKNLPVRVYKAVGQHLNQRLAVLDLPAAAQECMGDQQMTMTPSEYLAEQQLTKKGKAAKRKLMRYLKPQWDEEECIRAGFWLFDAVMKSGPFAHDEDGFPCIAPEYQSLFTELVEDLTWRSPVFLPFEQVPPPWEGFDNRYSGRLAATFVRKPGKETRDVFEEAFERRGAFTDVHVAGVSKLGEVALRIDQQMVNLVEAFAVDAISKSQLDIDKWLASDNKNIVRRGRKARKQRRSNIQNVAADVAAARFFKSKELYLGYNCDDRGRVYALSHLNYMRQDYVRSLFRFAKGELLGPDGLAWLEINCANAEGSMDKAPWSERQAWAHRKRKEIEEIAADPKGTFHLWRKAENPFQYVAACIELAAAWKTPETFETTLPIASDGSNNGLQHLAMIMRDEETAEETNLIGDVKKVVWDDKNARAVELTGTLPPRDKYRKIIKRVRTALENSTDELAQWWIVRLDHLKPEDARKMLKRPAMAYAYGITNRTMASSIEEYYEDARPDDNELTWKHCLFLANVLRQACKDELPKPTAALECIKAIVRVCKCGYATSAANSLRGYRRAVFPL
jgi:hypothetical protein